MSEALAAWNGYVFDRPRSPRWEGVYPGPEMALLPGPGRVMGVTA